LSLLIFVSVVSTRQYWTSASHHSTMMMTWCRCEFAWRSTEKCRSRR